MAYYKTRRLAEIEKYEGVVTMTSEGGGEKMPLSELYNLFYYKDWCADPRLQDKIRRHGRLFQVVNR